ncbi:hypothetical protein I4U23_030743 [Adineta vaga]|nr:hypothetical protein I4U23_030743 [Adineta vaga]
MSSSTINLMTAVSKYMTICLGIPFLIAGLLGACLNIIVFLSLKTFRQSSCAFFLTIMSFVNIGQLLTGLLSRILISGFNINLTETSLAYCKFRNYCLQVCTLTSYTCMCLATIDQFLATSLRPRWQQYLTIRKAYLLCILFFVIWLLHGIPTLIYYNLDKSPVSGRMICVITNSVYDLYITDVYLIILTGILPVTITIVFGSLAYRNVRQIPYRTIPLVRRELDKQLTSMVLVQVVHNIFTIVPCIVTKTIFTFSGISPQSTNYIALVFGSAISGCTYYLHFTNPFYIYVCVSKRFRQQFLHIFIGIYLKRDQKRVVIGINQIVPQNIRSDL